MLYGDLQFFDIIIFAGIAGFLIYRLRGVLGKRSGYTNDKVSQGVNEKKETDIKNIIPDLKENEVKLSAVYDSLHGFDHKNFLEGAKLAFESIINSYNKGDKKSIKPLLTKEVFSTFEKSIDEGSNNPSSQFYSLTIGGVEKVIIEQSLISITLKIISEQFKDGDESTVTKKQDLWTFQKNTNNKSTIWLLSST